MAWGRRCDVGCESWPDENAYKRCPICGEQTTRYSNLRPLDVDEAHEIKSKAEFEFFYAKINEKRKTPVDGGLPPTPEQNEKWNAIYPGGRPKPEDQPKAAEKA